jgi:hypothetical protein
MLKFGSPSITWKALLHIELRRSEIAVHNKLALPFAHTVHIICGSEYSLTVAGINMALPSRYIFSLA